MRLLDNSINSQDSSKLYKVGNVIKNGRDTYLVVVKDGNQMDHINDKFGLVFLRNGRLQYRSGECWFDTETELSNTFYDSGDVLLTGKNTFDME